MLSGSVKQAVQRVPVSFRSRYRWDKLSQRGLRHYLFFSEHQVHGLPSLILVAVVAVQSSPSIVLEMQHIKFDLVPAYKAMSMCYYIPKNSTDWQLTDPNGFNDNLVEANKSNDYKLKPVIRLMKYWNIKKNCRGAASFEPEDKLAQELKYAYLSCSSYSDYILKAFDAVRLTVDYSRADEAKKAIRRALEDESDGYPYLALSEIEKVFPEL